MDKKQSYERHRSHLTERYKKERAGKTQAGDGLIREQLDILEHEDELLTDEEYETASPEQRDRLAPLAP